MYKLVLLLLGLTQISYEVTFYTSTNVVQLTASNFDDLVLKSKDVWMVEFYVPWCRHCKKLRPIYEKVATSLKGIMKVGAIDAQKYRLIQSQYNIRGFPAIKLFGHNKEDPIHYRGKHTYDALVEAGLSLLKSG